MITSTLRNNLLGLPLDLASINIMRGRDVGIPSLNEARRVFFQESNNPNLRPYTSWFDFDIELRNGNNFGRPDNFADGRGSASLVNFIAAYGTHPTVLAAETIQQKRVAAELLVYGDTVLDMVRRIAGPDRYGTAAAVSASRFTGTAPVVYVAAGGNFPDALAGGPPAVLDGAPLLLVRQNAIPAPTVQELLRLNPQRIKVLGGAAAVGDPVITQLREFTGNVTRLSGADRYATAAAISRSSHPAGADTVFIASGRSFPDALSAGPAAAGLGGPVLLTQPNGIPAATATELARLDPSRVIVLGGPVAVSDAVVAQLTAQFGTVERIAGATRYETSVAISQRFFPANGGGTVYVATGSDFPDALAASAVAGGTGSPILLVPGQGTLPAAVAAELLRLGPAEVVVLGGPVAVSLTVEQALEAVFPVPTSAPADRDAFMNATGSWATRETGINDVDFWVGGLAERVDTFGNMLGPTFSYVFESQLEDLQFGDRFYYLFRNQGEDLFALLEGNTFSSLIQRNTNASLLSAEIFLSHEPVLDLENLPSPLPAQLRVLPGGGYQWDGDEHIEIHGNRTLADHIVGGEGDDALWGYGGNDRIEGRAGVDAIVGGPGDDILTDTFGDDILTDTFGDDNIKGGDGNDAINAGPGVDLVLGGDGVDFVVKPQDNSAGATGFLGQGDDIFLGGTGRENPFGGPGDDWMEGGPNTEILLGDRGQQFQDDVEGGDDILIGGPGSDDLDAEGGMDIMVGASGGTDRYAGMFGFDWVTYDGNPLGVDADLNFNLLQMPDVTAIRDRYLQVEALSGGSGDDILRGLGRAAEDTLASDDLNKMTEDDLPVIQGLNELLRPPAATTDYATRFLAGALVPPTDGVNNIILGGSGSDLIEGRSGNDVIDGDAVLRVRLVHGGTEYTTAAQLEDAVFAGTVNPGDITFVRRIVVDPGAEDDEDTLVYAGAYADPEDPEADPGFSIQLLHGDYWQIIDLSDPELGEGSDIVRNIEMVQFGDGTCVTLNPDGTLGECASLGFVTFGGQIDPPTEDEPLTAQVHFEDAEGNPTVTNPTQIRFNWQSGEPGDWAPSPTGDTLPDPGGRTDTFVPGDADVDEMLRVVVTFRDDTGRLRQIASGVVGTEANPLPVVENVNDAPSAVTLNTLNPVVGQGLLASNLSDPDGMEDALEEGLTYTWQSSGDGFVADIQELAVRVAPDDTTFGYLVQGGDVGRRIRVVITYTDDLGADETVVSPVTNPVAAAP